MKFRPLIAALGLITLPGIAAAHTGHGAAAGFAAGLFHPLAGLDHLLAMLTVGLWAVTQGGAVTWKAPLAFVALLIGGALLGLGGIGLPLVEAFVAASVLVLGLALMLSWRLPALAGIVLIGVFALFHGHAHGAEAPLAVSGYLYVGGMALASVALHLCGCGIGYALRQRAGLRRGGGVLVAGVGAWLLVTL